MEMEAALALAGPLLAMAREEPDAEEEESQQGGSPRMDGAGCDGEEEEAEAAEGAEAGAEADAAGGPSRPRLDRRALLRRRLRALEASEVSF